MDDNSVNQSHVGGVKTPEGKEISKYNALKHGILRQTLTEYEVDLYQDVFQQLEDDYKPDNAIEEMLVERVAVNYVKLFRLQKSETEYLKSVFDPRIVRLNNDATDLMTTVVAKGYTPKLPDTAIERLSSTYSRYETTIENRLYRALHELERIRRMKAGEQITAPITADVAKLSSFSET